MTCAAHGRKPNGSGYVRKKQLVDGAVRYEARVGGRYISTHETRAAAEYAIRAWKKLETKEASH